MKNLGTFLCKWTGTSQKCCFRSINTRHDYKDNHDVDVYNYLHKHH
jgi:hypothetical protein